MILTIHLDQLLILLQGRFCLDVASKCLELYATLFGVNYPLSKSDLVAVPDFAAGAMEVRCLCT